MTILSIILGSAAVLLAALAVACLWVAATNASRRQWKRVIFAILLAIVAAPASLFFWVLAAGSGENRQTVDTDTTGMK